MADNSVLSSLFSTNSLISELVMPTVANDLSIAEKFRKLPNSAIPGVPRNTETTLVEIMPRKKLTAIDTEFSDNTL